MSVSTGTKDHYVHRRRQFRGCFGVSAGVLAATLGACTPEPIGQPPRPTVIVEPVKRQTIPLYTDYVGRTEASKSVEIRARVDGFLERRTFREGSLVKKGDLLFVIDPKPYEAKVRQLEAQVQRREATLAKTKRDVDRLAPLFERNAASRLEYDIALSAREEFLDLKSLERRIPLLAGLLESLL